MHPTNRKVYLILLSVAFNGIFKSQGAEVKLMVCKTDSKQNAQKCLETKTSSNNAKPTTFQKDSFSFLFNFHKISCSIPTEFSLRSMSYLYFELYWKNYAKRLLSKLLMQQQTLQTKKTMKKEEIFFIYCKIMQLGKMMTR